MKPWFKIRRQRLIFGILCAVLVVVALPLVWFASNAAGAAYSYLFLTRPTTQELMGEYAVSTNRGDARLILREDGTFSEFVSNSGKMVDSVSGRWQNSSSGDDNATELIISPHVSLNEEPSSSGHQEAFFNFYKPKIGRIYGDANPDVGPRFVKQ